MKNFAKVSIAFRATNFGKVYDITQFVIRNLSFVIKKMLLLLFQRNLIFPK